jgi:enamine deaminase RidA (YjgF/YER057c/UK114 family)
MDDIVDLTSFHDDMRDLSLFMQVKDRYLTAIFRPGRLSARRSCAGRRATSSRSRP